MRDIRELFPTDDPVKPDLLIGRMDDVRDLASRLGDGTHMVMAGPRRTGKSTVGLAALQRVRSPKVYTAQVDLWDHESLPSLTQALAQSIIATQPAGRAPAVSLSATIALAQRIAEQDKKRIVLFLDEFQDIAAPSHRFGDPDMLTKQLRSELQRSPLVSVLFAGSMEHLMRDLFGPTRRALSQFGNFHELTPISPREWEAGIAARYRELDVQAGQGTIGEIVALGEGHPRTTMLIARETLTVALARSEHRGIELGDVRGGYELAMQADRLRHEEIVERLRSTAHAYPIALRVARGQRPYSGTPSSGAKRALDMMERAGIAERHGRGDWVIPEPLLRSYLAARL
jgi:hypothetical protein